MRLLGLDPGLGTTGWGVIEAEAGRLRHIGDGAIHTSARDPLSVRLVRLAEGLEGVIVHHGVAEAAIEETFVNRNAVSALRLGQARGIALLVTARAGLYVSEYLPNLVKKAVVGRGHADKEQVKMMVGVLLPGAALLSEDAADALAVAICHAHHRQTARRLAGAMR